MARSVAAADWTTFLLSLRLYQWPLAAGACVGLTRKSEWGSRAGVSLVATGAGAGRGGAAGPRCGGLGARPGRLAPYPYPFALRSPWGPASRLARCCPRCTPCCSSSCCCCRLLLLWAPASGGVWRAPPAGASWTGSTRWAAGMQGAGGTARGAPRQPPRRSDCRAAAALYALRSRCRRQVGAWPGSGSAAGAQPML